MQKIFLSVLSMGFFITSLAQNSDSAKIVTLNQEIAALKAQMAAIENRLNGVDNNLRQIEQKNGASNDVNSQIQALNTDMKNIKSNSESVNLSDFVREYGDALNQLNIFVRIDQNTAKWDELLNPESGKLGFTMSGKLEEVIKRQFESAIDASTDLGRNDKDLMKTKLQKTLELVTGTLKNERIKEVVGFIPYGATVQNIVGGVSAFMLNFMTDKDPAKVKSFSTVLQSKQNDILNEMADYVQLYKELDKENQDYLVQLITMKQVGDNVEKEMKNFLYSLNPTLKQFGLKTIDTLGTIQRTLGYAEAIFADLEKVIEQQPLTTINLSQDLKQKLGHFLYSYKETYENYLSSSLTFNEKRFKILDNSPIVKTKNSLNQTYNDTKGIYVTIKQNCSDKYNRLYGYIYKQ